MLKYTQVVIQLSPSWQNHHLSYDVHASVQLEKSFDPQKTQKSLTFQKIQ